MWCLKLSNCEPDPKYHKSANGLGFLPIILFVIQTIHKINCKKIRLKIYWVANDFFFKLNDDLCKISLFIFLALTQKTQTNPNPFIWVYRCVNSQSKINIFCLSNGPLKINKPKGFSPSLLFTCSLSLSLRSHH